MPRGFHGVKQASADLEARRNSATSNLNALWFRLEDGEESIVRFLEQDEDTFWCNVHSVPVDNRAFGRDVPCCNQDNDDTPCPGCERDMKRKFKGFVNVIWEDAPVFKRDGEGKMVKDNDNNPILTGHKPQVAVWGAGIRVFEELDEVNTNYRGLRSRRFKVKRKGKKLDTKYHISPADVDSGAQEFTSEEKKLEEKKYDLNEFVKPPTYDEFLKQLGEAPRENNNGDGEQKRTNPFLRNKS